MSQPGQPLFGITASNEGRVVIFGGGVPLEDDGRVVGAVGSSGGQPDQDHEVAEAGAAAFGLGCKSDGGEERRADYNPSRQGNHPPKACVPDQRSPKAGAILMMHLTRPSRSYNMELRPFGLTHRYGFGDRPRHLVQRERRPRLGDRRCAAASISA